MCAPASLRKSSRSSSAASSLSRTCPAQAATLAPVGAAPHAQVTRFVPLVGMGKARARGLPEVPPIAGAGYPGLEGDAWVGFLVPAGTPKEIVTLLHREIAKMIALPEMQERLATLG